MESFFNLKPGHNNLVARRLPVSVGIGAFFLLGGVLSGFGAEARYFLQGQVPDVVARLQVQRLMPATNRLQLSIGLPLRNGDALDELIRELYDPGSTNYHKFITPPEFAARFGPAQSDYQALIKFAVANGFTIVRTHGNRLVLDVEASATNVERAFHVTLHTYRHPKEPRNFFAPDTNPSVPTNLPVADIWGLSDYALPQPMAIKMSPAQITPLNYNGSGPGGDYQGGDFRNAYSAGSSLTGAGQIVAVAEFDGYYANDISSYETQCGYANVPLQNILLNSVSGTPGYSGLPNAVTEVSLDIELAIAMAPGLAKVVVYEGSSPYSVFSQIATDNSAGQVSCSWTWGVGPARNWIHHNRTSTLDSILSQMVVQGQAFFQASGDDDAYTGSQAMNSSTGPIPVDSVYVTSVGGTSLNMNGSGGFWSSESAWNYGGNTGSGGGISPNYNIPSWQTSVSMSANAGSTIYRNIPDVAMTADAVQVVYGNGLSGAFGGTSCAAPLWAGFCALVNQQSIALSGTTAGFLNPALYAIGNGTGYAYCFHDITAGNNVGGNTPGLFNAVAGYDLCTGWGTPNGMNLINALTSVLPFFYSQPTNQNVAGGTSLTFSVAVGGPTPFGFSWLLNGTNLSSGGNVSGTSSSTLSITSATANNAGNYSVIVINVSGSVTSSIATLAVGVAPDFSIQPTNLAILAGGNAAFSALASGSTPLSYQWLKNGMNLSNGTGIFGVNNTNLTLAGVTANSAANYALVASNVFGSVTSSVAVLTVLLPATINGTLTNQTIQCGGNAVFAIAASGTPPLNYLWSLDGTPVPGANSNSVSLINVHLPSHTVSVVVTNLYGGVTNNATLAVHDTIPPVITPNGGNPIYVELGNTFTNPVYAAIDTCAGSVPVSISGNVNTNMIGTNILTYTATDGNGNTNSVTLTVIVRDTTPPTISWSFTNLVLATDTNCVAPMPVVTGTNFIVANDLSGALTITQNPTNNFVLPLGTNVVVLTVADASGNTAFSTNAIVVQDQTPPLILSQPQSQTNIIGTTANFSIAATACTPLACQWFFNNAALSSQTNITLTLVSVNLTNVGNYSVTVAASGGSTTSVVATLTVYDSAPVITSVFANTNGSFTLNLLGTPGDTYVLETTTNLVSTGGWQPIATNTLDTNSVWQFNDAEATNYSQRFYRLKLGP
jgi:hypothetical protein